MKPRCSDNITAELCGKDIASRALQEFLTWAAHSPAFAAPRRPPGLPTRGGEVRLRGQQGEQYQFRRDPNPAKTADLVLRATTIIGRAAPRMRGYKRGEQAQRRHPPARRGWPIFGGPKREHNMLVVISSIGRPFTPTGSE